MVVYVIVALIVLWPVVRELLPRKAVAVPVLSEAVHEIEEAHHHTGLTDAVSVERRRREEESPPPPPRPDADADRR